MNGKVDFTYTGAARNAYGLWYISKGKVDFGYTGAVKYGGITYKVINGKINKASI